MMQNYDFMEEMSADELSQLTGGEADLPTLPNPYIAGGVAVGIAIPLTGSFGAAIAQVLDQWQPPTLQWAQFQLAAQNPALGIEFLKK